MIDFSVVQKAGLSAAEFALFVRYKDAKGESRSVTRAIAHRWITGQVTPKAAISISISKVLSLIEAAVAEGDLPLKLGTPRADRKRLIAGAIGKQLHKPKE